MGWIWAIAISMTFAVYGYQLNARETIFAGLVAAGLMVVALLVDRIWPRIKRPKAPSRRAMMQMHLQNAPDNTTLSDTILTSLIAAIAAAIAGMALYGLYALVKVLFFN